MKAEEISKGRRPCPSQKEEKPVCGCVPEPQSDRIRLNHAPFGSICRKFLEVMDTRKLFDRSSKNWSKAYQCKPLKKKQSAQRQGRAGTDTVRPYSELEKVDDLKAEAESRDWSF